MQLNYCLHCDLKALFLRNEADPVSCTNLVDYPKFFFSNSADTIVQILTSDFIENKD